jgi:hypothetical protein
LLGKLPAFPFAIVMPQGVRLLAEEDSASGSLSRA